MNSKEIIDKINSGEIQYPRLRQGEEFVGKKIYLYLLNKDKEYTSRNGLFDILEDAVNYFSKLKLSGEYYIYCKEQAKNANWYIKLDINNKTK